MGYADKYLTCGEFIDLCGITKNTLIWYEKKGLLKPEKVAENGYHYYALEQFYDIDLIKALKWADKSLKECREYLENHVADDFIPMLLEQQVSLERKLADLLQQKYIIDKTIQDYLIMQARFCGEPKVISMPESYLLCQPVGGDTQREYLYALHYLYELYHSCASTYSISSSMLNGSIVRMEDVLAGNFLHQSATTLRISAPIPHVSCLTIPAGKYLVCYHLGNTSGIADTYRKMLDHAKENGLEVVGDALEHDYINYLATENPEEYQREIMMRVK